MERAIDGRFKVPALRLYREHICRQLLLSIDLLLLCAAHSLLQIKRNRWVLMQDEGT